MIIGILPTIGEQHLTVDSFSDNPRYQLLNEQIFAARGEDLEISIGGIERLDFADTIAPEAACTSAAAPAGRARGLRPLLERGPGHRRRGGGGRHLHPARAWRETRIALFEQATDTRPEELKAQGVRPRVWFGERWITSTTSFEENVRFFPALLPVCEAEDPVETLERGDTPGLPRAAPAQRHDLPLEPPDL